MLSNYCYSWHISIVYGMISTELFPTNWSFGRGFSHLDSFNQDDAAMMMCSQETADTVVLGEDLESV